MTAEFKFFRGIKNASYLAAGNIISQIISFVGVIYIARLLGPDDYGIYVTVGAFVGFFEIILLDGMNKTIIREGSKDLDTMHITLEKTIGIRNLLVISAIFACIIFSFFMPYSSQTKLFIVVLSFRLANTGLIGFLGTIYQASEKMKYISYLNIIDRTLFTSLSIAFLYLGYGLMAVFLVALFSHFLTLFISFIISRKLVKFDFLSRIQFDKPLLKSAVIFSLMSSLHYLTSRVDILMITFLGTSKDVGIYGVAYKIAQEGVMLRNVNAMAFFPIFVKMFHDRKVSGARLVKYSLLFLIGIFVLTLAASFFVEDIVILLFGAEYKESGEILRILIFFLAFSWAPLPFTTAAQATHNEKFLTYALAAMAALNIPLNYIFFLSFGVIGIAYSTLVVYSIGGVLMSYLAYRVMKNQGYLS
jgi:O-antigen/teichoic acid export membrane protein